MKKLLVLILLANCIDTHPRRHQRREVARNSDESKATEASCETQCDAQWKDDFQVLHGKPFDLNFFDVPLDLTVISSRKELTSFCGITTQKSSCYKNECGHRKLEWTPERHICELHYQEFKNSINCLSKTKEIVHKECSTVCDRVVQQRISPAERKFLEQRKLSREGLREFERQNGICTFVSCHNMCHEKVVLHKCEPAEKHKTVKLINAYYQEYMRKEFEIFALPDHQVLFSSFCRRITPDEDENEFVPGNGAYNNRTLSRISNAVRQVVEFMEEQEQQESEEE
ncbi:unnamed protein product, partial [Mesorhabditis spiculigera]